MSLFAEIRHQKHAPISNRTWWLLIAAIHGEERQYAIESLHEILAPRNQHFAFLHWAVSHLQQDIRREVLALAYPHPEGMASYITRLFVSDFSQVTPPNVALASGSSRVILHLEKDGERKWSTVFWVPFEGQADISISARHAVLCHDLLPEVVELLRLQCAWALLHGFLQQQSAETGLALALAGLPLQECLGIQHWDEGYYRSFLCPGSDMWPYLTRSVRQWICLHPLGLSSYDASEDGPCPSCSAGQAAMQAAMQTYRTVLQKSGAIFT